MYPRNSHNKTIFGATQAVSFQTVASKTGTSKAGIDQFSLPFSKYLSITRNASCDFALQLVEVRGQRAERLGLMTTSIGDTGSRNPPNRTALAQTGALIRFRWTAPPKRLASLWKPTTLDPSGPASGSPGQVKHREVGRKMPAAPACRPAQSPRAATGDGSSEICLCDLVWVAWSTFTVARGAGDAPIPPRKLGLKHEPSFCAKTEGPYCTYSRNPGFTETRLRPLARRREMTARPPWVFIRVRKPCTFDRRRRFGWNVRFGMKSLLCSCP